MRIWWQLYINIAVILSLTLIILYVFFNLVLQSVKDFRNKDTKRQKILPTLARFDPRAKHKKEAQEAEKNKKSTEKDEKWVETKAAL